MDVQKVCAVNILSETESWLLFKEKVGTNCVDDDLNLVSTVVKDVVNECKGLPVALATVARALKDKRSESIWKDALRQLRASNPIGLPDVLEKVYKPLKLSYDFLVNPHAKSLFLLCTMFPEGKNISLEELTLYGWGLRMFGEVENLGEARDYVYALTDMLKSRSLLLDSDYGNDHVRMHDVIRDTAIFIASEERRFNLNSSSILLNIDNGLREAPYQIPDGFFEETNGLNVLSISRRSLPRTIQSLKHLRTLYLDHCTSANISVVGELSSLEILYCLSCDFKELPTEIGKLNRLRLVQINGCRSLKRISPGALSPLVQLEELKIVDSFNKWDIASLIELESLSNLTCLEIQIQDSALAAEELCLSQKIVHYVIRIGEGRYRLMDIQHTPRRFEKTIYLDLQKRFTPRNWIHPFLKNGKKLYLKGYDSNIKLDLSQNIKLLELRDSPTVKTLVSTTSASSTDSRSTDDVFSFLKSLWLDGVTSLEEICDGPISQGSNSFKNLESIALHNCPALKHSWKSPSQNVSLCNLSHIQVFGCESMRSLFSLAIAKDCIPQLGQLYIWSCKMMEQVLCNDENGTDEQSHRHITFPKLKHLELRDLERLKTFCKGTENVEFSLLETMVVIECPNLKSLVSWSGNDPTNSVLDGHHHNDDCCFHLFCNQKVGFRNLRLLRMSGYNDVTNIWCCQIPNSFLNGLERLSIENFNKIRSLFSSSIAQSLVNLKYLYTSDCEEMIQVIADGDLKECDDQSPLIVLLPNLEELYFRNLPKLESFCQWRSFAIQLPSLKRLTIRKCFHMERWSMGSLTTPNLQRIEIDGDEIDIMDDLNDILQRKYQMKKN